MGARLSLCFATAALLAGGISRADIYFYVDPSGLSHFSNVPSDQRYRLLLATASAEGAAPDAARWLARAEAFDRVIEEAAHLNAVQPALVRALIVVESGFNPRALSKRGAIG